MNKKYLYLAWGSVLCVLCRRLTHSHNTSHPTKQAHIWIISGPSDTINQLAWWLGKQQGPMRPALHPTNPHSLSPSFRCFGGTVSSKQGGGPGNPEPCSLRSERGQCLVFTQRRVRGLTFSRRRSCRSRAKWRRRGPAVRPWRGRPPPRPRSAAGSARAPPRAPPRPARWPRRR